MSPSPSQILVLGNSAAREMRPLIAELRQIAPSARWITAANCGEACALMLSAGCFPDLGVALQSWPDEHEPRAVSRLLAVAPLTRWICCYGSWCESDGRTRHTWPQSIRVSVRIATERFRLEWETLHGQAAALPWTAGRDETYLYETRGSRPRFAGAARLLLLSDDRQWRNCVQEQLCMTEWEIYGSSAADRLAIRTSDRSDPDFILWDADPLSSDIGRSMRVLAEQFPASVRIAVSAFAHPDDVARLQAAGAASVLPKLAPSSQWLRVLAEHAARRARPRV